MDARPAESLHEILTLLNSNRALEDILDAIVAQTCRLLDTAGGAIYRLHSQEQHLSIQASCGLEVGEAPQRLPADRSLLGQAVYTRRPIYVSDTAAPSYIDQPPEVQLPYRALLAVPLIVKDDVYGAIALYYYEPRAFADEDLKLATALSDQAALAIENARLVAAVQEKAVLEERQRLARDLHDSVTQALYGVTLHAEAAARLLTLGDLATTAQYLRELQETAQDALAEMRLLLFELRPPALEQVGLVAALQARLDTVEGRANLQTHLSVEGKIDLPAPIEQALYRIAQEALNNVLKHARARHIAAWLRQTHSGVTMEIADDGIGFDPAVARVAGGLGLRGMAERVDQLGGRLTVRSAPENGTQLRVEIIYD
jgi:signal transduction histidine kinase